MLAAQSVAGRSEIGGEIEIEISCTSLKLARYLILIEYSGKIAGKFVYRLVVYL